MGSHKKLQNCPLLQKSNDEFSTKEIERLNNENHKLSNFLNLNVDLEMREDYQRLKVENNSIKYL